MIYPVTMYSAKCDSCDTDWEHWNEGWTAMADELTIEEELDNHGWATISGDPDKHYCENCFTRDDEGNVILKQSPPASSNQVKPQ